MMFVPAVSCLYIFTADSQTMFFKSTSFRYNIHEMQQKVNSYFYQSVFGEIGFVLPIDVFDH